MPLACVTLFALVAVAKREPLTRETKVRMCVKEPRLTR
jgi:hypothetical protein